MKGRLEYIKNETRKSKNGKEYTACTIKIEGVYYNGFGNNITAEWQQGQEIEFSPYKEEFNGKTYDKFRTLPTTDKTTASLEARVLACENAIMELKHKEFTKPPY